MNHADMEKGQPAFQLAQLGAHAASQFAEKLGFSLNRIGKVAREHQDALLSALSKEERHQLTSLLLRIADQQGLVRGVHPGYRRLGSQKRSEANDALRQT